MLVARAAAALIAIAALFAAAPARAYCRSTTKCADPANPASTHGGKQCFPAEDDDDDCSSKVLSWFVPCTSISVASSGSPLRQIDAATADMLWQQAIDKWLNVDCDGTKPTIGVADLGLIECAVAEYNNTGAGNANELAFVDHGWLDKDSRKPYPNALALTEPTFDPHTGEIFGADMELNTETFNLGPSGGYDLASVLLHESGHFFGLAHSKDSSNVMFDSYTGLLDLSPDDIAGMCAIYPPDRAVEGTCDYVPRHGFASKCAADEPAKGCSISPSRSGDPDIVAFVLAGVVAVAARRRRRGAPDPHNATIGSGAKPSTCARSSPARYAEPATRMVSPAAASSTARSSAALGSSTATPGAIAASASSDADVLPFGAV